MWGQDLPGSSSDQLGGEFLENAGVSGSPDPLKGAAGQMRRTKWKLEGGIEGQEG